MASKKKWYRLNPRLWNIDSSTVGDITITHEPRMLSLAVADKVIRSLGYTKGYAAVVECEAPPPPPPPPVFDNEIEEETVKHEADKQGDDPR